jgi:hypothetical protein
MTTPTVGGKQFKIYVVRTEEYYACFILAIKHLNGWYTRISKKKSSRSPQVIFASTETLIIAIW